LNLAKKYVSYFKKENIVIKKVKQKTQQVQKKEQDNVGVHGFIVFSKL